MTHTHTPPAEDHGLTIGRNAVLAALRSGRPADVLFVAQDGETAPLGAIFAAAKTAGAVVKKVEKAKLRRLCGSDAHQGVVLQAAARAYADLEDLFAKATQSGRPPLFVVCDDILDPHNLGAIIRTTDAVGAHGVIVPKRGGAPLSFGTAKAAAGALDSLPVARVPNLCATLDLLKKRGLWIFGADMQGQPLAKTELRAPAALVIGSEGKGLGRLVREHCDVLVSLPMHGHVQSLNAAVAAGVLLYHFNRS